ncbi:MAG: sugar phosphate isomerase/epimerase family protein [Sediminibacterium sp.]|jgi:sugar phosphate isomerase/epimerase|nr:sugar phosphate isomerase/epimerase [uncultured Sediminibacterium sp.]
MTINRRNFLRNTGFAAAALSMPFAGKSSILDELAYKPLGDFGIQLWTVKEAMMADPKDTLTKLSSYGYKQIESFEGPKGFFWGMKNTEFKKLMDDLGMKLVSAHCNNTVDFEKKSAEAAEIGMSYLICPWKGPQKSIDDFKKFNDEFNKSGQIAKKNGIRFAYHNHDYSFKVLDGQVPQVVMMEGTDKDLVDFEMDIYWVVAAGEDPKAWFKKYPNRFRLCHVKDLTKTDKGNESCHIGKGSIDFKSILAEGRKYGLNKFIVEQEAFTGTTPMDSAKVNAGYMSKFQI